MAAHSHPRGEPQGSDEARDAADEDASDAAALEYFVTERGSGATETASEALADPLEASGTGEELATAPAAQAAPEEPQPPRVWASLPSLPIFLSQQPLARYATLGLGGFLALNVALVAFKAARKALSPQQRRHRTVNKNQLVVTTLAQYLPANRAGLAGSILGSLRFRTGFNNVEMFRKYLWYALRERAFKQDVVDDLLVLKAALQLTDPEVAEALRERAQRIYDKYGNVMLDTTGMTGAGIERKATSRALFSKLQYLTQVEDLLTPEAAQQVDLRKIFGATEDDVARLRIVSLQDVDLEKLIEESPGVPEGESPGETP